MTSNLKIIKRDVFGKRETRKLRKDGFVPGVIYGADAEPVLVAVGEKELIAECYSSSFLGHIIDAKIGNKAEKFLPKEITFHPVTDKPIHIDFQRISADSKVKIGIAVEFVNEDKSPGLKKGGVINVIIHKLECLCSPTAIPEKIIVDVADKDIGYSFLLEDIKLPRGISPAFPERDAVLATIVGATSSEADEKTATGEEEAEATKTEG
ncbi:MAG: 50S ribosomal protein L25/general stress protein Ctc [Holosporales bacterium]|nr:50S ribosomal protein L25/general stress protein Ctc [Holosporales bacterium]